ncbi:hypothetical protein [Ensifer canadensis]
MAPTSTPRVGWPMISTSGSRSISRATNDLLLIAAGEIRGLQPRRSAGGCRISAIRCIGILADGVDIRGSTPL